MTTSAPPAARAELNTVALGRFTDNGACVDWVDWCDDPGYAEQFTAAGFIALVTRADALGATVAADTAGYNRGLGDAIAWLRSRVGVGFDYDDDTLANAADWLERSLISGALAAAPNSPMGAS